jgi:hypothetical protein
MDLQLYVGARAYCLRVCCGFACASTLACHDDIQEFGRPQGTSPRLKLLLEFLQGTLLLFEFGLRLAHLHRTPESLMSQRLKTWTNNCAQLSAHI